MPHIIGHAESKIEADWGASTLIRAHTVQIFPPLPAFVNQRSRNTQKMFPIPQQTENPLGENKALPRLLQKTEIG